MIKIFDTTLRDGLQAAHSKMSLADKVRTFQDLDELGVPFIEVCWPAAASSEPELFDRCRAVRKQAKIVAFGSTSINEDPAKDPNLVGIINSRADYACIFGKTWLDHVVKQLRITPEQNLTKISESVKHLRTAGMPVIYDAEHFFDGYKDNPNYAIATLEAAVSGGAENLTFCDTNGGTLNHEAVRIVRETKDKLRSKGVTAELGTHFHEDSGMSVANAVYSADLVDMVQGTVNGMGERIGNLNWATFAINWNFKMGNNIDLKWINLKRASDNAWTRAGLRVPDNTPYVGRNAGMHKGGVHIDATNKGASYEHFDLGLVGNERILLLTTLGGRGSITAVAEKFGYKFDKKDQGFIERADRLFRRLGHLEERGYRIEAIPAEQFLLIEEYFGRLERFFEIDEISIGTNFGSRIDENSSATVRGNTGSQMFEDSSEVHGGPIHALYHQLESSLVPFYPDLRNLKIYDYHVDLARHHGVQSSVRTAITFTDGDNCTTVGVSDNIIKSATEAIEKGFRYYLQKKQSRKV